MIKINLKKLEKNLGFKLKRNTICLGVDTATTTGLALISTSDKEIIIETNIFKLPSIPKKIADQLVKAEKYEQAMHSALNLIRDYNVYKEKLRTNIKTILVLEQSFLSINPETFGYLRTLQGIFYSELYDYFNEIKIYLPTVARKLVGFRSNLPRGTKTEQKKKEICRWVSNIIEENITDHNIADAIILSLGGLKCE